MALKAGAQVEQDIADDIGEIELYDHSHTFAPESNESYNNGNNFPAFNRYDATYLTNDEEIHIPTTQLNIIRKELENLPNWISKFNQKQSKMDQELVDLYEAFPLFEHYRKLNDNLRTYIDRLIQLNNLNHPHTVDTYKKFIFALRQRSETYLLLEEAKRTIKISETELEKKRKEKRRLTTYFASLKHHQKVISQPYLFPKSQNSPQIQFLLSLILFITVVFLLFF